MYGKQYLEWVEGEACVVDMKVATLAIHDKHGADAYEYAIGKLYPSTKIVDRAMRVGGFHSLAAMQQQQAASLGRQIGGGSWPFGGLLG